MADLREELAQRITLRDDMFDFEGEMPEMSFELDGMRWASAEPDVGIMSAYLDDFSVTYDIGDASFTDTDAALDAIMSHIEAHVTDTRAEVAAMLEKLVQNEADNMEPCDDDYPDYDD